MSERKTDAAASAAVVQSTDTAAEAAVQAAEARAADAEQARADAESRAVAAESALKVAQEAAVAPEAYADYKELPAVVAAPLGLNLRTGPGPGYGVREVLPNGAPVTVLPLPYGVEVKDWALVVSESGTQGWVKTEFLAEPPAEE